MLSSFMGRRDTEKIQREEEEESFQLYSSAGGSLHPECPGTVRPFMRGCWKKEDWTENTRAETSKINREEGSSKSENTFFATVPQKSSRLISRDSLIVNTRIKRSIIVLARGSVYIRRRDRELHFAENSFSLPPSFFFFPSSTSSNCDSADRRYLCISPLYLFPRLIPTSPDDGRQLRK